MIQLRTRIRPPGSSRARPSSAVATLLSVGAATLLGAPPVTTISGHLPSGAPAASRPALSWRPCDRRFRCATLEVPIDYSAPSRGRLGLAVVELPSTSAHPVGDLVMNPGGPGGSGVSFLEQTPFPAGLRSEFNLVSFDPRGVGESDPVRCVGTAGIRRLIGLDPAPTTPSEVASVVAATKSFVAACAEHTPRLLLENMSSVATVEDMDRLRAALGEAKLNYLGFSYGTYLGELYAERYPTHLRAAVLDGVVDPALSTAEDDRQQGAGFETDLHDFFAWCPHDATCKGLLPGGAAAAYKTLLADLAGGRSIPAQLKPKYGGTVPLTLGVAETAIAGSLYSNQSWPDLAEGLAQALGGDGGLLAAIAYSYEGLQSNGRFQNQIAAGVATDCLDRPSPVGLSSYERLASELAKSEPDFGASEAWGSLPCAYWPVPPQGRPAPIHAPGSPDILLVGSTGDPATPYPWAVAVSHQLDHAELLTRDGPGHTAYFFSTCIDGYVDRYLVTLRMPPMHTTCPSTS